MAEAKRTRYSMALKKQIVAEANTADSIAEVARSHHVPEKLVYKWLAAARQGNPPWDKELGKRKNLVERDMKRLHEEKMEAQRRTAEIQQQLVKIQQKLDHYEKEMCFSREKKKKLREKVKEEIEKSRKLKEKLKKRDCTINDQNISLLIKDDIIAAQEGIIEKKA